jgi:hypothetical protein
MKYSVLLFFLGSLTFGEDICSAKNDPIENMTVL